MENLSHIDEDHDAALEKLRQLIEMKEFMLPADAAESEGFLAGQIRAGSACGSNCGGGCGGGGGSCGKCNSITWIDE